MKILSKKMVVTKFIISLWFLVILIVMLMIAYHPHVKDLLWEYFSFSTPARHMYATAGIDSNSGVFYLLIWPVTILYVVHFLFYSFGGFVYCMKYPLEFDDCKNEFYCNDYIMLTLYSLIFVFVLFNIFFGVLLSVGLTIIWLLINIYLSLLADYDILFYLKTLTLFVAK